MRGGRKRLHVQTLNLMQELISYFGRHEFATIFFGSIFFGESVIIPAILLSAQGSLQPLGVFLASFLGTVTADIGWYFFGKRVITSFDRLGNLKKRYALFIQNIERKDEWRRLLFFTFFKFIYGIRILTIIYFSIQKMPFMRFLAIDAGGTLLWLMAAFLLTWPAWRGVSSTLPTLDSFGYTLLAALGFLILFRFIYVWLSKKITKE